MVTNGGSNKQVSTEAARAAAARLETLAQEAHAQTSAETAHGGEPAYPAWIDDVKTVGAYIDQIARYGVSHA